METVIQDDELIGVEVRNTHFLKINGLTWEEVQDTFDIMKTLFDRRGYLYLREANKMFRERIDELKKQDLIAENLALKDKLAKKEGAGAPKTIGNRSE